MLPETLRIWRVHGILLLLLVLSAAFFMTYHAQGQWDFVLPLRGKKLLMLLVVAYAAGISTLLFQTLTHNPILTPGLLGYDAMYLLMQTVLLWLLGATFFSQLPPVAKFAAESALMMTASWLLFRTLTQQSQNDLARMILIGVIFGVLFRSLNSLLQRLIDPSQFVTVQNSYFAQFTSVNATLLAIGTAVSAVSAVYVWRMRHVLDILMLGRSRAIALGIDYARTGRQLLLWVALLVSVSTALVGPMGFFGLLVCAITNQITPSLHHSNRLPLAFLTGAVVLVLGQTVFEHVLGLSGVLSVVIELLGGLVFLWLVLHRIRRFG